MPTKTGRLYARISPQTEGQIADLARYWGGVRTLSRADVAAEAIRSAWERETREEEDRCPPIE